MTLVALDIETSGLIQTTSSGEHVYPDIYQISLAIQRSPVFNFSEIEIYEFIFPGHLDLQKLINKNGLWPLKTHSSNGLFNKLIEAMVVLVDDSSLSWYTERYSLSENHRITIEKDLLTSPFSTKKAIRGVCPTKEESPILLGKNLSAFDLPILENKNINLPFLTYRNLDIGAVAHLDYSRITGHQGIPSMDGLVSFFYKNKFDELLGLPLIIRNSGHDATVDCIHTLALYDVFKNRERLYQQISK